MVDLVAGWAKGNETEKDGRKVTDWVTWCVNIMIIGGLKRRDGTGET